MPCFQGICLMSASSPELEGSGQPSSVADALYLPPVTVSLLVPLSVRLSVSPLAGGQMSDVMEEITM